MDAYEFQHQLVDRTLRTSSKLAQLPVRLGQLAEAEPGELDFDVALERSTFRLRRYEPTTAEPQAVPILTLYPFINDPSILDFAPDRSVVGGFLEAGFPVYVFEWTEASPVAGSLTMGDYVDRYIPECVDVVRGETGADAVHLHGYSTSAPFAAAYAAYHPESVRTLLLQGPPLDFDADESVGQLRTLAAHQDLDLTEETIDAVYTPLLEVGFAMRKPVEYTLTAPLRVWDRLDDEAFVDEQGRTLDWVVGGPTLPEATISQYVRELVLENRLIRNELRLNGEPVDLDRVTMPVALVVGCDDAFVPREASTPFLDAVPSDDTVVFEFPTGHVGLSTNAVAHETWWPRVREWLTERS